MTPDLLRPFEEMLNRRIAGSSRARAMLAALAGRSLELRFAATPLRVRLAESSGTLTMRPAGEEPADAVIEGTPLSFLRLATDDAARSIRAGGMDVRGDAEIAEGFRRLLEAARPDFEEELSRFTGDAAAHYLAGFARDAAAFGRRAGDTLARNTAEYLTEESRDLPVRVEVEEFLEDVDRLREAVDRLESRVAIVERPQGPA
jgi:ubiquinone biosynthesis accessory factor UbiJ